MDGAEHRQSHSELVGCSQGEENIREEGKEGSLPATSPMLEELGSMLVLWTGLPRGALESGLQYKCSPVHLHLDS